MTDLSRVQGWAEVDLWADKAVLGPYWGLQTTWARAAINHKAIQLPENALDNVLGGLRVVTVVGVGRTEAGEMEEEWQELRRRLILQREDLA